jgi:hypothetical protein
LFYLIKFKIVTQTLTERSNTICSFVDEEESMQRRISVDSYSKPELVKSFPEFINDEVDEIIKKEDKEAVKETLPQKVFESPVSRTWRLIKATMFSQFEYNGEFTDIIKEIKKSLRQKFKKVISESCKFIYNI